MFPETIIKISHMVNKTVRACGENFKLKSTDVRWITNALYERSYQIAKEDYSRKTGRDMRHWNFNFRQLIHNSVQRQIAQYL